MIQLMTAPFLVIQQCCDEATLKTAQARGFIAVEVRPGELPGKIAVARYRHDGGGCEGGYAVRLRDTLGGYDVDIHSALLLPLEMPEARQYSHVCLAVMAQSPARGKRIDKCRIQVLFGVAR